MNDRQLEFFLRLKAAGKRRVVIGVASFWALWMVVFMFSAFAAMDGITGRMVAIHAAFAPVWWLSGLLCGHFYWKHINEKLDEYERSERASRRPPADAARRPAAPPPRLPLAPPPPPLSPPAPLLDQGEAARRKAALQQAAAVRPAKADPRALFGSTTSGGGAAGHSLRFAASGFDIEPWGLNARFAIGPARPVRWADLAGIAARQLPPDPPWNGGVFLELVPDGDGAPLRIVAGTVANFAKLQGGAGGTGLDNLRRLAEEALAANPAIAIDDGTRIFLRERKAPPRFATLADLVAHDARWG